MQIRFTLKPPKPRNPLVAASRRRLAGAHRGRDHRQREKQSLRVELERLRHPSP